MDNVFALLAKVLVGGFGLYLIGRRAYHVVRRRRLWREQARAGRAVKPTTEELRKHKLESIVSLGALGFILFGLLWALLVVVVGPHWSLWAALGLAIASAVVCIFVETFFLT